MRILVIGGTAFIGPPSVKRLANEGHEVAVFHRGKTEADPSLNVKSILGDRRDLSSFAQEFRAFGPDAVLDMFPLSEQDARTVVELFRGVAKRVVAVSSMDVYRAYGVLTGKEPGPPDPTPLTEDSPLRENLFPYRGVSERLHDYEKILVERMILGDPDLPGTVLRLPMVYGPRDYQHRLFPYLKRMDDGRPAVLLGKNNAAWRTTRGYVENVAAAIALAVLTGNASGKTFNVGDEPAFSEREWVMRVGREAGWKGEVVVVPDETLPGHLKEDSNPTQHLTASTERIRKELGFDEVVSLEEGIRRTVEWERGHPPETVDPANFDYEAEDEAMKDCGF